MTASGDFISGDGGFEEAPSYPTIFGVQLTPVVSGTLVALLGLAGAVYLLINVVQPAWQQTQTLEQTASEKRSQLVNQEETQRQIEEARKQLKDAEQLQADVLALFATEKSLETLLLDVNARVQSVNAGITDPARRANLSKFQASTAGTPGTVATAENLVLTEPDVVNDSAFGTTLNGRLERVTFNVELQGDYAQTQSIMRNIERLQPLLIVQDFKSELDEASQRVVLDEQGRLVPNGQPLTRITTSFQLIALLPVSQPPAAPAPDPNAPADPNASPSPSP